MNPASVLVVIPARYGSTRLHAKPLADLLGQPMIQYVYEGAMKAKSVERVIVATDDPRIEKAARSFGAEVMLTSSNHETGTDRIAEVAGRVAYPWIVNLQGDLPLIHPEMLDGLIEPCVQGKIRMGTLAREITREEDLLSPHVVKVVMDAKGRALYFSRSPIPFLRDGREPGYIPPKTYFKHYGIYFYQRDFLFEFTRLPRGRLEQMEKLEQLRALEAGQSIRVIETKHDSWEVDTPADLEKVKGILTRGGTI